MLRHISNLFVVSLAFMYVSETRGVRYIDVCSVRLDEMRSC